MDPRDIPNGYSVKKHCALESTIAKGIDLNIRGEVKVMACHETHDSHCIGWLVNQLGPGNNIPMRFHMTRCTNGRDLEIVGEQHGTLEETIPT